MRPGASGSIGIKQAIAAKPDGYTLYVGYTSETVVVPQISKNATYSATDDFEPIAITGMVLVFTCSPALALLGLSSSANRNSCSAASGSHCNTRTNPSAACASIRGASAVAGPSLAGERSPAGNRA